MHNAENVAAGADDHALAAGVGAAALGNDARAAAHIRLDLRHAAVFTMFRYNDLLGALLAKLLRIDLNQFFFDVARISRHSSLPEYWLALIGRSIFMSAGRMPPELDRDFGARRNAVNQTEIDQQLFQVVHRQRRRDHELLVAVDRPGQCAVLIGLRGCPDSTRSPSCG